METGLSVRELLTEAELGFRLLTGEVGLDRLVEGVHHSDLPDPTPWMVDGTLLITHGAPFAESTSAGIDYLGRLAEKTVGLVVAVGTYLDEIPQEHIEHAGSLGLPLLEVPQTVAIRTILSYVYHALASQDMHRLRRALAVHSQLLDLLVEDRGIGEVVSRLASSLSMGLVLFDATGEVIATAGPSTPVDTEHIWRIYLDSRQSWGPLGILEAEHGRVQIRRVIIHGSVERIVAAVSSSPRDELADMALSYAQRVIALDLVRERENVAYRRRIRSLLLHDFLSREDDAHEFVERLRAQDIDVGKPWRLLAFRSRDRQDDSQEPGRLSRTCHFGLDMATEIEGAFGLHDIPSVGAVEGDAIVVLAVLGSLRHDETRLAIADVLDVVEAADPSTDLRAGVSSRRMGCVCPAAALRQALESLRSATEGVGATGRVIFFDDASGSYHLLEGQSVEALIATRDRLVSPLEQYDREHLTDLVVTLRAFLESRLSIHETAEVLFVHRNTLHKRLRRIEDLLHLDLHSMDDVMELYIALRAADLLRSPKPAPSRP